MTHESLLSGLMTESFALQAMGARVRTEVAVDQKPAARKWIKSQRDGHFCHLFRSFQEAIHGEGVCEKHGRRCRLPIGPDLATAGLPCQPFSQLRSHQDNHPAQDHVLFDVTFVDFISYLNLRKPKGFVCEQVVTFNRLNPKTNNTFLVEFGSAATNLGYLFRAVALDARDWGESERPRFHGARKGEALMDCN